MKTCNKCKITKELLEYSKDRSRKDGLSDECKDCVRQRHFLRRRTKNGVVSTIYNDQKSSSKKRSHNPPTYTKQELKEWIYNQPLFHKLYYAWVRSDYEKDMKPSVDRFDDDIGYSFNNIQLMTWKENKDKSYIDRKNGKLTTTHKPVRQYTKDGIFIEEFVSAHSASRQLNILQENISACCRNKQKTAGGFIWSFKLS